MLNCDTKKRKQVAFERKKMLIPKPPKLFHRTTLSEENTSTPTSETGTPNNPPSAPFKPTSFEELPRSEMPETPQNTPWMASAPAAEQSDNGTNAPTTAQTAYADEISATEQRTDMVDMLSVGREENEISPTDPDSFSRVAEAGREEVPQPQPPKLFQPDDVSVAPEMVVVSQEPKGELSSATFSEEEDMNRFARPPEAAAEPTTTMDQPLSEDDGVHFIPQPIEDLSSTRELERMFKHFIQVPSVNSIPFADLWFSPEGIAYVRDTKTKFALVPFESDDLENFRKALEQGYTGASSYSLRFAGEQYRVERIMTTTGVQYNCRKMPTYTPDIYNLGLPKPIIDYLVGLAHEAGLVLFGGPTGMGKTTTASALMKKWLENEGGFLYTIEDPPEMPLDGLYRCKNGGLGLCKQTAVENERWGDCLKSALRSRPRYILVGEIRTPETASQALRAATSGHLVVSTIHASSVEDALNSMIKYAAGTGLPESLVSDLLARGILASVHQKLEGIEVLTPKIQAAFANPKPGAADQMRMIIRDGKINLSTLMEAQEVKLFQGKPLFKEI